MKTDAEQFEINFVNSINPWADNEAREAKKWTLEARCAAWVCEYASDSLEWFRGLPNYEQSAWMLRYESERSHAQLYNKPLRSAESVMALREEAYQRDKAIAEQWAKEIRDAFLHQQPCPIIAEPPFQWLLEWAFRLAVIPKECLSQAKLKEERAA